MRILHVIHGLTTGGAEIDLLRKLRVAGEGQANATSICCLMRRGELAAEAVALGINVDGPLMRRRFDATVVVQLRRIILNSAVDIVHSHLFAANFVTWLALHTIPAARRPGWIASEHAMAERWDSRVLWADRQLVGMVSAFTVPTQAAAQSYAREGIPTAKLHVAPNAVDTGALAHDDAVRTKNRRAVRILLGIDEETFVVGTVSRLEPVKNLTMLLDAVRPLDVLVLVVGDGSCREELEQYIRTHGMAHKVRLLGRRDDVPQLLPAFDVFAQTSSSESFGLAVIEALLAGTPVVATAVGAIPEVTDNGRFATLIPLGDVDAFRQALMQVQADSTSASILAQTSRPFIEAKYSSASATAVLHQLYRDVLS